MELYTTFPVPTVHQDAGTGQINYGKAWAWDFETGDFKTDGGGKTEKVDSQTAWKQWCVKALQTGRFAFLAYDGSYGHELDEAKKQPSREAIEADAERTITETLMADPRTQAVRGFEFKWYGSDLDVSFIAIPVAGMPEGMKVVMNG